MNPTCRRHPTRSTCGWSPAGSAGPRLPAIDGGFSYHASSVIGTGEACHPGMNRGDPAGAQGAGNKIRPGRPRAGLCGARLGGGAHPQCRRRSGGHHRQPRHRCPRRGGPTDEPTGCEPRRTRASRARPRARQGFRRRHLRPRCWQPHRGTARPGRPRPRRRQPEPALRTRPHRGCLPSRSTRSDPRVKGVDCAAPERVPTSSPSSRSVVRRLTDNGRVSHDKVRAPASRSRIVRDRSRTRVYPFTGAATGRLGHVVPSASCASTSARSRGIQVACRAVQPASDNFRHTAGSSSTTTRDRPPPTADLAYETQLRVPRRSMIVIGAHQNAAGRKAVTFEPTRRRVAGVLGAARHVDHVVFDRELADQPLPFGQDGVLVDLSEERGPVLVRPGDVVQAVPDVGKNAVDVHDGDRPPACYRPFGQDALLPPVP